MKTRKEKEGLPYCTIVVGDVNDRHLKLFLKIEAYAYIIFHM